MSERAIHITQFDLDRLEELLAVADEFNYRGRGDLKKLEEELHRARVMDSRDVSPTIVTMNSRVRLRDIDTGEQMEFTLVFPKDADIKARKLSVLAPIGTAILGYSVGDTIEWNVPAGIRRIKIEELLYQPEAAGDYNL